MKTIISMLLLLSFAVKAQNIPYEKLDSISAAINQNQLKVVGLPFGDKKNRNYIDFPENNFKINYSNGKVTRSSIIKGENSSTVSLYEDVDLSKATSVDDFEFPGNVGIVSVYFPKGIIEQTYQNGKLTNSENAYFLLFYFNRYEDGSLKLLLDQLQGMFKTLKLALNIPAALYSINQKAEPLTIDNIIDKHIEALGGAEKVASQNSLITQGILTINGNQIPVKSWVLHNQGMRMDMEIQGRNNITATTPNRSWTLYPTQRQRKPVNADPAVAKESAEELDLTGDLFNYKIKGNTVELLNKEKVDGKEIYIIKVTRKSGTIVKMFIDTGTFLVSKTVMNKIVEGKVTEMTQHFNNYKKTKEGYVYASSSQLEPAGLNLIYSNIEFNAPIDPQIFENP
ncbi:hypothetical protein [Kaistella sp.]|uniref:hypothetical protein n=1 Tax=Kaistella sp. TaxID=2782235 RepID=UPI003C34AF34